MSVEIKTFANFREIVGEKKIEVPGKTVGECLVNLIEEHEDLKDEIFDDYSNRELNDFVNILVDGERLETIDGLDQEVENGTTISIFPPVSGGMKTSGL
ncbi:MAG: ubiquitin-like small modifier protein 1, partial [Candidatus Aenigmatarchaeota archaeon]